MKKLSQDEVIEIVNNNEELLFEKFELDESFDYYIGEELCSDWEGIGYDNDNGDRGIAFMSPEMEFDFETCGEEGLIELDGEMVKYVRFVC